MTAVIAIIMTFGLILTAGLVSFYSRRFNTTTAEFYLAGRKVGLFMNASAICGDYFSAASFLGVAGAVYASGLDGLWFGAGWGAGFVPVLIFFASPIRRFGEYTLPDFLAARFGSPAARIAGVIMVQLICAFYLAPQVVGAGLTWEMLVGVGLIGLSPYATGVLVVALVLGLYAALGGMRGTTLNQTLQFWVLFIAVAMVVALVLGYGFSYAAALGDVSRQSLTNPERYTVAEFTAVDPQSGVSPLDQARSVMNPAYWERYVEPHLADPEATVTVLIPQTSKMQPGAQLYFNQPGHRYTHWEQFSLVLALVLGTAGLPHIMNRYYTNPSGWVARLTTVWVLVLVAAFYIMAGMLGTAGRFFVPEVMAQVTDPHVLRQVVDGVLLRSDLVVPFLAQSLGGDLGLGLVAAGAFAAMFSTIGGLLLASAASWGHDLYEQFIAPDAPEWQRVAVGKAMVVVMCLIGVAVGLSIPNIGLTRVYPALIALMVTWAFAVSAGAFVPVLFLSIWWKRITLKGALAGMLIGGIGSVAFIVFNILRVTKVVPPDSVVGFLGQLTLPTVITLPLAVCAIWAVSMLDQRNVPAHLDEIWVRIHGTARERTERRLARLTDPRNPRSPYKHGSL